MVTKPSKTRVHTVYKDMEGKRVPSVTTVLGILNKPALLEWAWKLGTEGLDYKSVRDEAGGIGTLAHYMILCEFKGEKPDTSEYSQSDIERAENCLIKFWDWEKEHEIEPILLEEPLVSNSYGFGGTIDFYGYVDGKPSLLDFKTGKAIYPDHLYQLSAYEQLLKESDYDNKTARILRIGRTEDEGFEDRVVGDLSIHWQVFLCCLSIYKWQKKIKEEK
jgi:hypothetical protein